MNCANLLPIEVDDELIFVDCGKCLVCLSNKRTDWSFRLEQEYKGSRGAAFVTLTYSEKFLPKSGVCKRHLQLYLKRLRKKIGKKIRYYAVAEYGTKTGRGHYHLLLFNVDGEDTECIRGSWTLWDAKSKRAVPIGIVHVGRVSQAAIMYVTKYIIQSKQGSFAGVERERPFALMSRGYGIGACYLTDEMLAWHRGSVSLRRLSSRRAKPYSLIHGQKARLPRYYFDKIWPRVPCTRSTEWLRVRSNISKLKFKAGEEARLNAVRVIRENGHKDPDKYIAEMRHAVVSRISSKVAFTQKF